MRSSASDAPLPSLPCESKKTSKAVSQDCPGFTSAQPSFVAVTSKRDPMRSSEKRVLLTLPRYVPVP